MLLKSIRGGRHPVIERQMPYRGSHTSPNDIRLKSRFGSANHHAHRPKTCPVNQLSLRQCALISLLAQIGSFVPADAARSRH